MEGAVWNERHWLAFFHFYTEFKKTRHFLPFHCLSPKTGCKKTEAVALGESKKQENFQPWPRKKHASSCSIGRLLLTIITEPTLDPFLLKPSLNIPARLPLNTLTLNVPIMPQSAFTAGWSQVIPLWGSGGLCLPFYCNHSAVILSSTAIRHLEFIAASSPQLGVFLEGMKSERLLKF